MRERGCAPRRVAARGRGSRRAAALFALLALVACSERSPPEERIRAMFASVEAAAEARNVGGVLDHVADEYADDAGRTRRDLAGLVRGWFALHPALALITRVEELEIESDDYARARVTVGVLARRGAPEAWDAAAEVRTVEVRLRRDGGEWRVLSARWER